MNIGNIRDVRFYPGRCEDCGGKLPLEVCAYPLVSEGSSAELCESCAKARREEHFRASTKERREVGFTPAGDRTKWTYLPNLLLCLPEGDEVLGVKVEVIYRQPTVADLTSEDGGEIKVRIGESDRWLQADFIDPKIFGFDPGRAMRNAQMALQAIMTEHHVPFTKISLA